MIALAARILSYSIEVLVLNLVMTVPLHWLLWDVL